MHNGIWALAVDSTMAITQYHKYTAVDQRANCTRSHLLSVGTMEFGGSFSWWSMKVNFLGFWGWYFRVLSAAPLHVSCPFLRLASLSENVT